MSSSAKKLVAANTLTCNIKGYGFSPAGLEFILFPWDKTGNWDRNVHFGRRGMNMAEVRTYKGIYKTSETKGSHI